MFPWALFCIFEKCCWLLFSNLLIVMFPLKMHQRCFSTTQELYWSKFYICGHLPLLPRLARTSLFKLFFFFYGTRTSTCIVFEKEKKRSHLDESYCSSHPVVCLLEVFLAMQSYALRPVLLKILWKKWKHSNH